MSPVESSVGPLQYLPRVAKARQRIDRRNLHAINTEEAVVPRVVDIQSSVHASFPAYILTYSRPSDTDVVVQWIVGGTRSAAA